MTIYKIHVNGQAMYDGRSLYYKNLEDAITEVERIWLGYQIKHEKLGIKPHYFPYIIEESKDKRKLRFYTADNHYCFESIIKIEVNE